jgi:hypothetical protein
MLDKTAGVFNGLNYLLSSDYAQPWTARLSHLPDHNP